MEILHNPGDQSSMGRQENLFLDLFLGASGPCGTRVYNAGCQNKRKIVFDTFG